MNIRDRVKKVFQYLFYLKGLNQKVIRNVKDYDNVYFNEDFINAKGCVFNKNINNDWWICISKSAKGIYDDMFNLYENIEKKGENLEIVLGSGILAWKVKNKEIVHPLFTTAVHINFDLNDEKFYLKLNDKVNMDVYFLKDITIHNYSNLLNIKEKFSEQRYSNDIDFLDKYAEEILTCLTNEGWKYTQNVSYKEIKLEKEPVIYKQSLFIVRKADTNLWKNDINTIIESIDNGEEIPKTVQALVTDDVIEETEEDKKQWEDVGKDTLFPLIANEEQRQVVQKISGNFGVVMQGPPGTGKSHTIANLICHLLAHGKRVLVTSETSRALKVLRDKIPDEIKSLCISMLGNDTKSIKELEDSVTKIVHNLSCNPRVLEKELEQLKQELKLCRDKQNLIIERIKYIDDNQVSAIKYGGESYKLVDIAKWLKENEKNYSWIEDKIKYSMKAPISQGEFNMILSDINILNKDDINKVHKIGGIINKIPSYDELKNSMAKYIKLKQSYEYNMKILDGWNISDNEGFNYLKLKETLNYSLEKVNLLQQVGFYDIFVEYHEYNILKDSMVSMIWKMKNYLKRLIIIRNDLNDHNIQIPRNVDLDRFSKDFNTFYNEVTKKGKINNVFMLFNKRYSYIAKECQVDYEPIETVEQATIVKFYLEEKNLIKSIINLWNNTMKSYSNVILDKNDIQIVEKIEGNLKYLDIITTWNDYFKGNFNKYLGNIQYPKNLIWNKKDTIEYLLKAVSAINEMQEYKKVQVYLNTIKKLLYSTKEFAFLEEAIETLDYEKLKNSYDKINNLKFVKDKVVNIEIILNKLKYVCPKLCNRILLGEVNNFNNWSKAWKWRQLDCILDSLQYKEKESLENKLEKEKEIEAYLIKQIICKQTWCSQIMNISEKERRSLVSWLNAVKRIGKGRGKYVSNYIKLAQMELENCKKSIPVWIMPINKLIENMKVSDNKFDVIICDESSQSNIFALCALMRAKKAVIVGDDKQISPEPVGIANETVQNLIEMHLKHIPHKQWFDLQTSFYDTALRVFPERLMLKEHFRCVPEIIEFSNKTSYSNEIVPLRYAEKFERFDETIKTVKISDGARDGSKGVNIKEADAIVETICKCCNDKKYGGMTMGVISLLGDYQSEYIQNALRNKIGEKEMIKRRIICGDAYSFQGDERDVMFLSMVIANNAKFNALTKESDIRRFNVASSRAKNQLWVFYSVDLQDLSKQCIRYSFLDYCINYKNYQGNNNKPENLLHTQLQKDVYEIMVRNNYNVRPNIFIGGHKIDFVIEGFKSRAAIICQDSNSNSVFDWKDNFDFYLKLKYAGWEIIKIEEINFYRNTGKVMDEVFNKLNYKGIFKKINNHKMILERDALKVV